MGVMRHFTTAAAAVVVVIWMVAVQVSSRDPVRAKAHVPAGGKHYVISLVA